MKLLKKVGLLILALGIVCVGVIGTYKLYNYEQGQSQEISELLGKVEYLEEKLRQTTDYYEYETNYSDDSFNYFAIGNSLTMITSWGRGICSTQPDNDYFNLVSSYLKSEYGSCVSYAYNFSTWERSPNRTETLDLLDIFLDQRLDLVTIQLGENVTDISSYQDDLEYLISYIEEKCPNAMIIMIGDWWSESKNEIRYNVAQELEINFADLSAVIGDKSYQSTEGQVCYLEDGETIQVSAAAASHPGDKGMRYIADKVIEFLGN